MSKRFKEPIGLILVFILSIMLGFALMIFIYTLPTEPMRDNLKKSMLILENELHYEYSIHKKGYYEDFPHTKINTWSDSIMLMQAIYPTSSSAINDAMLNKRPLMGKNEPHPGDTLLRYLNDQNANIELNYEETERTDGTVDPSYSSIIYPRYWHGYLLFLKPALLFTDLSGIRLVNSYALFTLMLISVFLIYKRLNLSYAVAFFLTLLFLNPVTLSISLQYDAPVYIMLISIILLLLKNDWLSEKNLFPYFFLCIGILVAFFDFLTFPLIAWLIPWLIYFMLYKQELISVKNYLKNFMLSGFYFGLGYVGMWIGKWIMCYLVTRYDIFSDVLKHFLYRMSNTDGYGSTITFVDAISYNIGAAYYDPLSIVILSIFILISIQILRKKFIVKKGYLLPFLIPALIPFIWYAVLTNHSYISALSTYRHLSITLFAFLAFYIENDRD